VRDWRGFAVRVSLLFAAVCTVIGTQLPFYPVWLDWRGLSAREIATITAAPLVVRVVVTPALAFAADRFGDHRRFLIGLAWAGLAVCWCWRNLRASGRCWSARCCSRSPSRPSCR
jgi:PPP family 3-phenylpropionic acid transporter